MSINEIIVYLMVVFMALGAVDRILGNRFGLGEKFEEGIMAMGSLALAMIRVLTGISIMWFLLPGYALSLALSFVVPKIFTSIAFDSGGVASGPMTATFLLPFAMGACDAVGGNVVTDAFGVVAMVAMTPLVTIQLLGVSYKRRIKHVAPAAVAQVEEIIELA